MSRQSVACVTSKPRAFIRARSCSWLRISSPLIRSRTAACRRAFITIQNCELSYTSFGFHVYLYFAMDTPMLTERGAAPANHAAGFTRVGVAGATGFAGQELLRWMAGHPAARITTAMSSAPEGPARQLPALSRIWDGVVEPFS